MEDEEASFAREVLQLPEDQTEDALDEYLRRSAKELDIDIDALLLGTSKEMETQLDQASASATPRRSASMSSRVSQSTGLTSDQSRNSKEQQAPVRRSRLSPSFRNFDSLSSGSAAQGRQSVSSLPSISSSQSSFSLPKSTNEPTPRKSFGRFRGFSRLKLKRNSSSASVGSLPESCLHCPQDEQSQRRAIHRLACGHSYCTQAMRKIIKATLDGNSSSPPSCCGRALPESIVEQATSKEEQAQLMGSKRLRAASVPSITSEASELSAADQTGPGAPERADSATERLALASTEPGARTSHDGVLETAEYKALRLQQEQQLQSFVSWAAKRREILIAEHKSLKVEMLARHEEAVEDLSEQHALALAEAEDKQVQAEADMRAVHAQEKRNNTTALRHTEAFCSGSYTTGMPHDRPITDQDRKELEKTQRMRDQMDARHQSAINVLRGEQSRRIRARAQRQEKELIALCSSQASEVRVLTGHIETELRSQKASMASRRARMESRWTVQQQICRSNAKEEDCESTFDDFAAFEWPQDRQEKSLPEGNLSNVVASTTSQKQDLGISTGYALQGGTIQG